MTPLPQRKKTAEEIAQLRDQLGVPQGVDSSPSEEPAVQAEQVPAAPVEKPTPTELPKAESAPAESTPVVPRLGKSHLPSHRHSDEELDEIRRREMLSQLEPPAQANFKFAGAHPALIILGYLLAAAGSCIFWLKSYPLLAVVGGSAGALVIAGFLALRRPVSRHHAGFISAIAVIVGVFATIHQLPQLQHAS